MALLILFVYLCGNSCLTGFAGYEGGEECYFVARESGCFSLDEMLKRAKRCVIIKEL